MPFTRSRAFTKGLSTEDLTNLLETLNWRSTLKPLSSEQSESKRNECSDDLAAVGLGCQASPCEVGQLYFL